MRAFLSNLGWAAGARACPCGREVGREIVDRHYRAAAGAGCRAYSDFSELLSRDKDLLGNIPLRVDKKLRWHAASGRVPNAPEAEALITRTYREGWALLLANPRG